MEQQKIFSYHITNKGLIQKYARKSYNSLANKQQQQQNPQFKKKGQRTGTDIFLKKTCPHTVTQHHYSGKCKSKPQ